MLHRFLSGVGIFSLLLLVWFGLLYFFDIPHYLLPTPMAVANAMLQHLPLLAHHALYTATAMLAGLVLGSAAGIICGAGLYAMPRLRRYVHPLLLFSQIMPIFALAPLIVLWMGYGLISKITVAVLVVFFPVCNSLYDGLLRIPVQYLELAHTMRARKAWLWRRVLFPAALPALASGMRLAALYTPVGVVLGEWVGSSAGLGYLMLISNGRLQTEMVFAALCWLTVLALTLYYCVNALVQRQLYWKP